MSFKQTKIYGLLLLVIVVIYCFIRDTHIEAQYCGDLRNRVVAARLQIDGHLPYFYKWKVSDGVRYYDPQNFDSLKVSNITASPIMHELLYPLAELQQKTISFIWLVGEYLMLIAMLLFAVILCKTNEQLITSVALGSLFLFTDAWLEHIANGQIYLLLPFLTMVFYLLIKSNRLIGLLAAGLCAFLLIAIRPTYIFFFLPFLLLVIKFERIEIVSLFLPSIIIVGLIICNKQERFLWQDYKNGITEQIKIHQNLNPIKQINAASPNFRFWEGYDMLLVKENTNNHPFKVKSKNGNFFAFYEIVFHKKISVGVLNSLSIGLIMLFLFAFYYKCGFGNKPSMVIVALFGFCIYMISEFLSPIHRHQYNAVVWLFPILIMAINYKKEWQWFMIGVLGCLLMNVNAFTLINLPQTIAEYGMWLILMIVCIRELYANKIGEN